MADFPLTGALTAGAGTWSVRVRYWYPDSYMQLKSTGGALDFDGNQMEFEEDFSDPTPSNGRVGVPKLYGLPTTDAVLTIKDGVGATIATMSLLSDTPSARITAGLDVKGDRLKKPLKRGSYHGESLMDDGSRCFDIGIPFDGTNVASYEITPPVGAKIWVRAIETYQLSADAIVSAATFGFSPGADATDNGNYLQLFIDELVDNGGVGWIPSGNYNVNGSQINGRAAQRTDIDRDVVICCAQDAKIINLSTKQYGCILSLACRSAVPVTAHTITSDLAAGATVIPLSEVTDIEVGDIIYTTNTTSTAPITGRGNAATCSKITAIDGNNLTVNTPLGLHVPVTTETVNVTVYKRHLITVKNLHIERDLEATLPANERYGSQGDLVINQCQPMFTNYKFVDPSRQRDSGNYTQMSRVIDGEIRGHWFDGACYCPNLNSSDNMLFEEFYGAWIRHGTTSGYHSTLVQSTGHFGWKTSGVVESHSAIQHLWEDGIDYMENVTGQCRAVNVTLRNCLIEVDPDNYAPPNNYMYLGPTAPQDSWASEWPELIQAGTHSIYNSRKTSGSKGRFTGGFWHQMSCKQVIMEDSIFCGYGGESALDPYLIKNCRLGTGYARPENGGVFTDCEFDMSLGNSYEYILRMNGPKIFERCSLTNTTGNVPDVFCLELINAPITAVDCDFRGLTHLTNSTTSGPSTVSMDNTYIEMASATYPPNDDRYTVTSEQFTNCTGSIPGIDLT